MATHSAQSIGTLIAEFLRGSEAEKTLLERRIPEIWKEILGQGIAQFTGDMEVKNGVLYVHIYSAALRQQLFEQRHLIVKKINQTANANLLTDIRLLG